MKANDHYKHKWLVNWKQTVTDWKLLIQKQVLIEKHANLTTYDADELSD